jgi:DegV family protein with EDD domain
VSVAVLTDSSSALPAAVAASAVVTVVPAWLDLDGRRVRDGEIGLDEVLGARNVSTSGPSPGEWERAVGGALADHDHAVVITVAAELSGTYQSARLGVAGFEDRVTLLDSGTAAGGQALVAQAAGLAATGADDAPAAVAAAAASVMARVRVVGAISSYDHLVRSGRVPGVAAKAAEWLRVRPLFEVRQGRARPLLPARAGTGPDRIVALCLREQTAGDRLHAAVMHAGDAEQAEKLLAALEGEVAPASVFLAPFGPAMVAHTGPDLLGLAWWWEPASPAVRPGGGSSVSGGA